MEKIKAPEGLGISELEKTLNGTELIVKNNTNKINDLESKIKFHEAYLSDLQLKVTDLNAKTQATADFSDDLVSSSSTLIASVEDRVDKTLEVTDQVLTYTEAVVSTYLVVISIIVAVVGTAGSLWIQHKLAKTRETHLMDAVKELTTKLNRERDFRDDFINSLVKHKALRENINTAIDNAVRDRVDSINESQLQENVNFKEHLDNTGG